MAKIYTKTGDKGYTSLVDGKRISKSDLRIEAYGTVDELNAHIGLLNDLQKGEWSELILKIQHELFVIGSHLANDNEDMKKHLPTFTTELEGEIENTIDTYTLLLPPLKNFILPGGNILISQTHICRTVTRRAERCIIRLKGETNADCYEVRLLNRLSDYFFVLGRYIGNSQGVEPILWNPKNKP
ncbi:MAG: cob(I)yrinic acid a,c-diamide adenosyltransferase [Leadbetterella sp.]